MKKNYLILILIMSWLFWIPAGAQNLRKHQKDHLPCKGMQCQELADQLFSLNLHYQAIKYYLEVVNEVPDHEHSLLRLSQAYQEGEQYAEALRFYEQLISIAPEKYPEALYHAGLMAQALGESEAAAKYFNSFLQHSNKEGSLQEHAQLQLKSIRALSNLSGSTTDISSENLENSTGTLQYAATPAGENKIMYVTVAEQIKRKVKEYSGFSGKYDTIYVNRLMQAALTGSGVSATEKMEMNLPADEYHAGSACLSKDGNTLYFTLFSTLSADNFCHIYQSKKNKNGKWSDPEKLLESINVNGSVAKDPMLIQDPKQGDVLFFSSNKPGGKGGFDLYYALKDENGQFSQIHNLGDPVNTAFDEVSPFFDQTSKNLYFSSNGHMGFGHLDVYLMLFDFSRKKGHLYNMGYPVNTTANDYYFSILNSKTGFVTTNHKEKLEASHHLHLQKLSFKSTFTFNTLPENAFEVESFDQNDSEGNIFNQSFAYKNIPASAIDVTPEDASDVNINGQLLSGEEVIAGIHLKLRNQSGEIIDSLLTDENGKFSFRNLPADEIFSLFIDAEEGSMTAAMAYQNEDGDTLSQFNSNHDQQYFRFRKLEGSLTNEALVQNEDVSMYGDVLRNGEIVVGELIYLTDLSGKVLDTTQTDAEGKFIFRHLHENAQYLVKMLTDEQGMLVKIIYKDGDDKVLRAFNSKENSQYFIFQNLPVNETIASKVGNEDTSMLGEILRNGEIIVGELIILADLNGNPLDSTYTDKHGKFCFRQLKNEENYLVQILTDENGMLVRLEYQDEEGNVLKSINSKDDQQYFAFQALEHDQTQLASMNNEDISISGEIFSQSKEKQMVLLVDEQGNIVQVTNTDEQGRFNFRDLPAGKEYVVWLNENDQEMTVVLNFKDKNDQVIKILNSDKDKAFFDFKNLSNYTSELSMLASNDDTKFQLSNATGQTFIKELKTAMTYQYYESLEKKYGNQLLDEINLRVQIGAYSRPKPDLFKNLKEADQVESELANGLTKYLVGNFDILASAESLRQSAVDQGIGDAFIAVYHAGKRVAILIY